MAVVTLTAANISPLNDTPFVHRTYRNAAAVTPGLVCIWNASGYITPTGGSAPAAGVSIAGIALQKRNVGGTPPEVFQEGFLPGFDVSGLAYHALLYAGANGTVDTTGNVIIGEVLPFGATGEKMAYFDVRRSWLTA